MNKSKVFNVCLYTFFFILLVFCFIKIKDYRELREKTALAFQIHKGLEYLMLDLAQARERSIVGVPADGQWHEAIEFNGTRQGTLIYEAQNNHLLRISRGKAFILADHIKEFHVRRLGSDTHIVEVVIKAKQDVSLEFNLKIRIFS